MSQYKSSPMDMHTQPPPSATSGRIALTGIVSFLASVAFVCVNKKFFSIVWGMVFILMATALMILLVGFFVEKVHLRKSTGMDPNHDNLSLRRSLYKYLGMVGSFGFIAVIYWLFPEYHGSFYARYYQILCLLIPACLVAGLPYIVWVDRRMPAPFDGYWHMGKLVTFQWQEVNFRIIGQHLTGWLIKGFFLPLMFIYCCDDLQNLQNTHVPREASFKSWYDYLFDLSYFSDVGLCSMGYIFSLRIAGTHIRSAEPTLFGWFVALICYEPFWSFFSAQYISYSSGFAWGEFFSGSPFLYTLWGSCILTLTFIYVWATVSFGASFSNLTHRGIITNGPYRYTKHPAYISKNLSWWMISMPFVVHGSYSMALRDCLLLLLLNTIYFLRAKTEERHLARDQDYVQYVAWIEKNGKLRFLNRIPFLKLLTFRLGY